ncbi:hypothetical protein Poli38472_004261 [Pythium oligandrum]|uniref:Dynein assembly factor 1, axonemal homolog n=1 Tax=Pythium oligandrum TaxID=41045 RepID=A0A8K1FKW3_PYTOL|nr:hypothetical protein Poli38472_004261 [Pythium oligandrum]|eukprot:TMW66496.1 hypothetical protein Poli38472_004261 [Pythium oligandrum]
MATTMIETFERLREREKQRFREERKGKIPVMDAETLKELCVDNDGYETPELNDNLYAHFQGFQKIEGLEPYFNLKALWLESNGLTKLENLEALANLRCLYLSKNLIERVENLEALKEVNTLDLSENKIKSIAGISCLPQLSSLNLSRNLIESSEDLRDIQHCTELTNLDISHNHIDDPAIVDVLKTMTKLRALRITGNEVVSKTKYFRKVYISTMPHLSFLDRPIFPVERAGVEAWARGGNEAELAAKRAFVNREHEDRRRNLQEFREWQAQIRERRLKEIADEQAQKEQEPEHPEDEDVCEDDVDLRGFRGITKQEYLKLSTPERAVWDERIEAAHRDSVKAKHEVLNDGVAKIGAKFWAEEDAQKVSQDKKDSVAVEVGVGVESTLESTLPPPAPASVKPLKASRAQDDRQYPGPSESGASIALPTVPAIPLQTTLPESEARQSGVVTAIQDQISSIKISDIPVKADKAEETDIPIIHPDMAKFFQEVGETRRTWAELERQARESPFLHRPMNLPSMMDDISSDNDDDDTCEDKPSHGPTSSGFPIRALTREELLADVRITRGQSGRPDGSVTSSHHVPMPQSSSQSGPLTQTGVYTNVADLD